MASTKEIEKELNKALQEIGPINPWFDKEIGDWVFAHKLYPVECGGTSREEVVEKYPLYLRDFIEERLKGNLAPTVEKKTQGHGGRRPGAGRPKETAKEPKSRIYLPEKVATWLKDPNHLLVVEKIMQKNTNGN